MKKIIAFLLILGFASSSCEPDDICEPTTPTTPRMLIQFFEIKNPSVMKNVDNLKVIEDKMSQGVVLSPTQTGDSKYLTSGNQVLIPLNTEGKVVKYRFINNYGKKNPLIENEDILEFNYSGKKIYVSRACGYKTIFNLDATNPFVQTEPTVNDGKWMRTVIVLQNNITYENETIIKVLF